MFSKRRDGRAVDSGGLENRWGFASSGSSNLSLSASTTFDKALCSSHRAFLCWKYMVFECSSFRIYKQGLKIRKSLARRIFPYSSPIPLFIRSPLLNISSAFKVAKNFLMLDIIPGDHWKIRAENALPHKNNRKINAWDDYFSWLCSNCTVYNSRILFPHAG